MKNFCCICGCKFKGYGNNLAPLKTYGSCCDNCHVLVLRKRVGEAFGEDVVEEHGICPIVEY